MRDKTFHIADTYGTYYGLNQANKLVAVNDKSLATKFSFLKASNILQNMIKPSMRYQYVLVEAGEDVDDEGITELPKMERVDTRFDNMDTDWKKYLEDVLGFASQLQQYKNNLMYMYSDVEKEICDLLHYIEFNTLDAANGYKIYKMLRECRVRRRQIKDENIRVSAAIRALGGLELQEKLQDGLCQIRSLDNRTYRPRILEKLFEEVS